MGVSYLLPRIIGPTVAFEMMLTGRLIDAAEAQRVGLVLEVVPDGQVVDAAVAIAEQICANTPFGVRMTKQVMWANLDARPPGRHRAREPHADPHCHTRDHREAIQAFIEKRAATFTNS